MKRSLSNKKELSRLARAAHFIGQMGLNAPRLTLLILSLITISLAPFALSLSQDDDVIRFLPEDDPEVKRFREIGRRFHGLTIAIVGFEAHQGEDLFDVRTLRAMRILSRELRAVDGVTQVTSFTELPDITESVTEEGQAMSEVRDLVGPLPPRQDHDGDEALAQMEALRARVLSRDHLRGSLVSEDGRATLMLCQIHPDADLKASADAIRTQVNDTLNDTAAPARARFGGAPFIGSYAAEETRQDIVRLTPWVILAVVIIMLLTSRSLTAVFIALSSVGVGIAWVLGGLELSGRSMTLVSSSLPVLLVALGSAYSIHLLTATLSALDQGLERRKAISQALMDAGPPVIVAGLTTAAGFLSFLVMDVAPMRDFGLEMALATIAIVLLSLVLVPAASMILPISPRKGGRAPAWARGVLTRAPLAFSRHPTASLLILAVLVAPMAWWATQVRAHADTSSLFTEESEPAEAERFLESYFGGSLFLQVQVEGDIRDPLVLRQIQRLVWIAEAHPQVLRAQSVAEAVAISGEAMLGERRIPLSRETTASLTSLAATDSSVRLMVDDDWSHALIQLQLKGSDVAAAAAMAPEVLRALEQELEPLVVLPREKLDDSGLDAERAYIQHTVALILRAEGIEPTQEMLDAPFSAAALGDLSTAWLGVLRYNLVDDPVVFLRADAPTQALMEQALERLAKDQLNLEAFRAILHPHLEAEELEEPEALDETLSFILHELQDLSREKARASRAEALLRLTPHADDLTLRATLEAALWSLFDQETVLPYKQAAAYVVSPQPDEQLSLELSGYPMVYAGMNRSVERNQLRSLASSAVLVLIMLALFFRRPGIALLGLAPAVLTLILIFGLMGGLSVPMDVGTSMIAAIALGVGIDYAVHLLWQLAPPGGGERKDLSDTLSTTGWGIVINALEVSVGLSLLAFGTVIPMRNFGLLTAAAMLLSALTTLLLVPAALARSRGETLPR